MFLAGPCKPCRLPEPKWYGAYNRKATNERLAAKNERTMTAKSLQKQWTFIAITDAPPGEDGFAHACCYSATHYYRMLQATCPLLSRFAAPPYVRPPAGMHHEPRAVRESGGGTARMYAYLLMQCGSGAALCAPGGDAAAPWRSSCQTRITFIPPLTEYGDLRTSPAT